MCRGFFNPQKRIPDINFTNTGDPFVSISCPYYKLLRARNFSTSCMPIHLFFSKYYTNLVLSRSIDQTQNQLFGHERTSSLMNARKWGHDQTNYLVNLRNSGYEFKKVQIHTYAQHTKHKTHNTHKTQTHNTKHTHTTQT